MKAQEKGNFGRNLNLATESGMGLKRVGGKESSLGSKDNDTGDR